MEKLRAANIWTSQKPPSGDIARTEELGERAAPLRDERLFIGTLGDMHRHRKHFFKREPCDGRKEFIAHAVRRVG